MSQSYFHFGGLFGALARSVQSQGQLPTNSYLWPPQQSCRGEFRKIGNLFPEKRALLFLRSDLALEERVFKNKAKKSAENTLFFKRSTLAMHKIGSYKNKSVHFAGSFKAFHRNMSALFCAVKLSRITRNSDLPHVLHTKSFPYDSSPGVCVK